jgi:hypothetical protein
MLVKQKFYVPLTEGLNTKKDDRFLIPGEVKALENGVYRKEGKIDKKNGFVNLTKNILGGGTLSDAKGVYSLDDELLVESNGRLYSYSENSTAWVDRGPLVRTSVETQTITRNTRPQANFQFGTIGNIRVYVYENSDASGANEPMHYSVQDIETGTYYVYDQEFSASLNDQRPRVLTNGTTFYIFYWNGASNVSFKTISTSTPTVLSSAIVLLNGVVQVSGPVYDANNLGSDFYVSYHGAGNTIVTNKYASANFGSVAATNTVNTGDVPSTDLRDTMKIVFSTVSGTSYVHVAWANDSNEIRVRIMDTSLSNILSLGSFAVQQFWPFITGAQLSPSSHTVQWFACQTDISSAHINNAVFTGTMTTSGVGTNFSYETAKRGLRLATDAFIIDGSPVVGVVVRQDDQRCIYLVDEEFNVITKIGAGAAGIATSSRKVVPVEVSGSVATVGFYQVGTYIVEENQGQTVEGLALSTVNFDPSLSCSSVRTNNNLYLAAGLLKVYDGATVFEDSFPYYPTMISVQPDPSSSIGDRGPGTFQYTATYEWLDNKGNLHRSSPAIPGLLDIAGDVNTYVSVSILSLSKRVNFGRSDVKIVLWRTNNTGTGPFYRLHEISNEDVDPTGGVYYYVSYLDGVADEDLTSNEILYTQGGVLENIQAPATTSITNHKNHLVITGLEDAEAIRSTKPAFRFEAPGFNEGLEVRTASEGGKTVTVASMDDKLIIFKEKATYFCVGDGPDVFGAGMFTSPQLVSDTIGCPYKNSVVLTPDGLMFQSSQGIYLLSRALELIPIGDSVEDYTDSEVVNVVKIKDQNEVRFCQANGNMLVYSFDFKKWSVFPDKDCVGSTIWQDKHVIVDSTGQVSYEDSSTYLDNSVFVPIKATTGWIQLDEIAGLQRIYKVQVVGEYHTPHKLTLDISYDNNDAVVETHQLSVSSNPNEYIFECRPRRQKCSSIQFTLRDVAPNSGTGTGKGLSISGLRLICGVKTRLSNVPNTRRL